VDLDDEPVPVPLRYSWRITAGT